MKNANEWINSYSSDQAASGKKQGTQIPQQWVEAIQADALESAAHLLEMEAGEGFNEKFFHHFCANEVRKLKPTKELNAK